MFEQSRKLWSADAVDQLLVFWFAKSFRSIRVKVKTDLKTMQHIDFFSVLVITKSSCIFHLYRYGIAVNNLLPVWLRALNLCPNPIGPNTTCGVWAGRGCTFSTFSPIFQCFFVFLNPFFSSEKRNVTQSLCNTDCLFVFFGIALVHIHWKTFQWEIQRDPPTIFMLLSLRQP